MAVRWPKKAGTDHEPLEIVTEQDYVCMRARVCLCVLLWVGWRCVK